MKTIRLTIDLKYDDEIMHGDDVEAIEWFYDDILMGNLILHSSEMGDEIGRVTVISNP